MITLKPCRSPYCECAPGKCTHPGCYDARFEPNPVPADGAALPPIEHDENFDRTYIPVPGGYEFQTKGKGSSYRIAQRRENGDRWIVCDSFFHDHMTVMALAIREAYERQAEQIASLVARLNEVSDACAVCVGEFNAVKQQLEASEIALRELAQSWRERVAGGYMTGDPVIDARTEHYTGANLNCADELEALIAQKEGK